MTALNNRSPTSKYGLRSLHSRRRRSLKKRVFERDNFTCVKCGSTDDLTVDHKRPVSQGGKNNIDNLETLCWPCNKRKAKDER